MFWIQRLGMNNSPEYRFYNAEFTTDLDNLPTHLHNGNQISGDTTANKKCALGSECLCFENKTRYVLSNNGWQEIGNTSGGGGDYPIFIELDGD